MEQGVRNKEGKNILNNTISRIVKNPIYIGIIRNGESKSEMLPDLQIISPELFARAQKIVEKRARPHSGVPLTTRGQSLLVLATSGQRYKRKDGTIRAKTYASYQCNRRLRRPGVCGGQACYSAAKVNNLVDQIIRIQFERVKQAPPQSLIEQQQTRTVDLARARLKLLNEQYQHKQRDYQAFREETLKVVQGSSRLNVDMLNSLIDETNAQSKDLERQLGEAGKELQEMEASAEQVQNEYTQLMNWAELYDNWLL